MDFMAVGLSAFGVLILIALTSGSSRCVLLQHVVPGRIYRKNLQAPVICFLNNNDRQNQTLALEAHIANSTGRQMQSL